MALLVRCPKCGETKEHPETILGQVLQCAGCDQRYLVAKVPARGNYALVKPITGSGKAGLPFELRGPPTCKTAVLSLVLGIAGFVTVGVGGLAALVLGALSFKKTGEGTMRGRGLAIAGMATGALSIVAWVVIGIAGDAIWDAFTKPDEVTRYTIASLDAALKRYHDDWGKFPWTDTTADGLMGAVDETPKKSLRPIKGKPDDAEALLYAALNCRLKKGPYVTGGRLMTLEKEVNGVRYRVFCDGWSHQIHYGAPDPGKKKPLLESAGEDPLEPNGHLTN